MKANELRIGNIIKIGYGYPEKYTEHKIIAISPNDYGIAYDDDGDIEYIILESCKPIPLTEEWLLKFGFEKLNNGWYSFYSLFGDGMFYQFNYNVEITKATIETSPTNETQLNNNIKYVHQLQNLYFALTNKELEIKD